MTIKLNNRVYEAEENSSLLTFMQQLEIKTEGIAVAIDCNVIPKEEWDTVLLKENMELMIIRAVSGG